MPVDPAEAEARNERERFQFPARRQRILSLDTSDDSSVDEEPRINELRDLNRQESERERAVPLISNAQREIEAIEAEQPSAVLHPFSIGLMKKIDTLDLPVPIKKYLNHQRNFS
jgi:hypothetical protein